MTETKTPEDIQEITAELFDELDSEEKGQVIRDSLQSVIEQELEDAPKEPIRYNEERIKAEHKKILDEDYRVEVEVLEGGTLPCKAHKTDAGFDLYATSDVTIGHGLITKHPLNIKLSLPKGTHAQITSKSGLGVKGLLVYAGIIDESYRGIPHVICTMLGGGSLHIKKGQKIAQLIMQPYSPNYFMEDVDEVDDDTDRGEGGFGSSGE